MASSENITKFTTSVRETVYVAYKSGKWKAFLVYKFISLSLSLYIYIYSLDLSRFHAFC